METIIQNEKKLRQKRRQTALLVCALLVVAATNLSLEVVAFGLNTIPTSTTASSLRLKSTLRMKPENSSYRNQQKRRTMNGSTSAEVIARKAALVVDSGHSPQRSDAIRDRVNRFLRSKKRKSKFVKEVNDIDSIYTCLGEGQKESVFTAVIFHAPYCRACKASMPLFEELARQYNKKNKKISRKLRKKRVWLASDTEPTLSSETSDDVPRKQPIVKFLSVPVTSENSKELQDQFAVTKFPLAHIYDPVDGLVDERPLLRKLFPGFQQRLESVLVDSSKTESTPPVVALFKNVTMA